jgi:hypothetical protein
MQEHQVSADSSSRIFHGGTRNTVLDVVFLSGLFVGLVVLVSGILSGFVPEVVPTLLKETDIRQALTAYWSGCLASASWRQAAGRYQEWVNALHATRTGRVLTHVARPLSILTVVLGCVGLTLGLSTPLAGGLHALGSQIVGTAESLLIALCMVWILYDFLASGKVQSAPRAE